MPVAMAGKSSETITAEAEVVFGGGGVFRVGDEGDVAGGGFFDSGNACDLGFGISVFQGGAERRCDFSKFHNSICCSRESYRDTDGDLR